VLRPIHALTIATLMPLLPACADAMDACNGEVNLVGTGQFAALYGGQRDLAASLINGTHCDDYKFFFFDKAILEDEGPECLECAAATIRLPAPLFVGRTFGPGTQLGLGGPYVTEGSITVVEQSLQEEPEACNPDVYTTLRFDLSAKSLPTWTAVWHNLGPSDHQLKGTVQFNYGGWSKDWKERELSCGPPDREDGDLATSAEQPLVGSVPNGPTGPGLDLTLADLRALPVDSLGVRGHRVDVDVVHASFAGTPEPPRVDVVVEHDAGSDANPICGAWAGHGEPPHEICGAPSSREEAWSADVGGRADGETFRLAIADGWGLVPSWDLPLAPDVRVRITAPPTETLTRTGDSVELVWEPALGAAAAVTVRAEDSVGNRFVDTPVPDTGSHTLDAEVWRGATGFVWVSVERAAERPLEEFATGSRLTSRVSDTIRLKLEGGASTPFADPAAEADGWTAPTTMATLTGAGAQVDGLVARGDDTGAIHVGWSGYVPGSGDRVFGHRVTSEPAGSEARGIVGHSMTRFGMDAAGGRALLWASLATPGQWQHQAFVFTPGAQPARVEELATTTAAAGFEGAILPGGGFVLGLVTDAGELQLAQDGGGYVARGTDAPLHPEWLYLHALSTGEVAAQVREGDAWRVYQLGLEFPTAGRGITLPIPTRFSRCFPWGQALGDVLWALCGGPVSLARYSLWTGTQLGEADLVTEDEDFNAGTLDVSVSVGSDRTAWVLLLRDCPYGVCPVLFRGRGEGWDGPIYPGYAHGTVAHAVGADGRVHLFWTEGGSGDVRILHATEAVQP